MVHQSWFVLPPVQEWYYKKRNPYYQTLPPVSPNCESMSNLPMEFIYPRDNSKIFVPIELDNTQGKTVFEVAHRTPEAVLYWHLDGVFIGSTQHNHQMALSPPLGKHTLVIVDNQANYISKTFEIVQGE